MNKKGFAILFSVVMVLVLFISACQPQTIIETVEVEKIVESTVEVEKTVVVEVEKENPADKYKLAAILPGVITDADYNTLGYIAMTTVQNDLGMQASYSESVPVPDFERVAREYIDQGYNILFVHGNQFLTKILELAPQFPEIVFITECDNPIENQPTNVWLIDRNFNVPYYIVGYIAGKQTKTGKIGYLSGPTLPFSYQEYHAIEQALKDSGSTAKLVGIWAGDFNDPTKARQLADQMIGEGVDVIMGSLNLGMFGVFEAAKAATTETQKILVTAKYIDKTNFAKDNYITAPIYDFATPLKEIVTKVMNGETGGYYNIQFGSGVHIQMPLKNVPEEFNAEVQKVIDDINSGKIVVVKDATEVKQ